jgi:hypothetical protein
MVKSAGSHATEQLKPTGVETFQHVVFGDRTDSELRTHDGSWLWREGMKRRRRAPLASG